MNYPKEMEPHDIHIPDSDDSSTMKHEAERIREDLSENMANYHDDPPGDTLVDDDPESPNGLFGDHEDDFDIG